MFEFFLLERVNVYVKDQGCLLPTRILVTTRFRVRTDYEAIYKQVLGLTKFILTRLTSTECPDTSDISSFIFV